jgi:hypothetical protein
MERADTVVEALESYKLDHGRYPAELQALVPRYLKQIAPPLIGTKWGYSAPDDGARFILAFEGDDREPCGFYEPNGDRWIDTK